MIDSIKLHVARVSKFMNVLKKVHRPTGRSVTSFLIWSEKCRVPIQEIEVPLDSKTRWEEVDSGGVRESVVSSPRDSAENRLTAARSGYAYFLYC